MTPEDLVPLESRRSGEARETAAAPLPHVIAWNLTKRCNLACAHCYIAAGSWQTASGELSTTECHDIVEAILSVNPSPMLVLSGGEPLLRDDLEEIAAHASRDGATVVVGTNGTRLTDARIASLMKAGVSGVAVSVDSLDPRYHDRFRHGAGALEETVEAVARLREHRLDFVIQTEGIAGRFALLPPGRQRPERWLSTSTSWSRPAGVRGCPGSLRRRTRRFSAS